MASKIRLGLATAAIVTIAAFAATQGAGAATSSSPNNSTDPYSVYTKLDKQYNFTGSSIDKNYWSAYSSGPWHKNLAHTKQGYLTMNTWHDEGSGLCLCKATQPTSPYGRWDFRAKTTADPDHGFAILLWPNSEKSGAGEIDLAEFSGDRKTEFTTVHYGTNDDSRYILRHKGDWTGWHTYSIAWSSKELDWSIDGKIVMALDDTNAIPDTAFHPVIQAQAYHPDNKPSGQATMTVQWVRRYVASS